MDLNPGRSYPTLALSKRSADSRVSRCASRLFAAALFGDHFQIDQKNGRPGAKRPIGPLGVAKVQQSSATLGLSRLATNHALGGFMMRAVCPAISALLLDASS